MSIRWSVSVAAFLLMALVGLFGCGGGNSTVTPTGPVITQTMTGASAVTVDPLSVTPQFLPGPSCGGFAPFATHLSVIVTPGREGLFVRGISFNFLDQRGVRTVPSVGPVPTPTPPLSPGIPTSSPIPIPGQGRSIFLDANARSAFLFDLRFRCGFAPRGILSIGLDMMDPSGAPSQTQLAVRVGS